MKLFNRESFIAAISFSIGAIVVNAYLVSWIYLPSEHNLNIVIAQSIISMICVFIATLFIWKIANKSIFVGGLKGILIAISSLFLYALYLIIPAFISNPEAEDKSGLLFMLVMVYVIAFIPSAIISFITGVVLTKIFKKIEIEKTSTSSHPAA